MIFHKTYPTTLQHNSSIFRIPLTLLMVSLMVMLWSSCEKPTGYLEVYGNTMGSTYQVKYKDTRDLSGAIDSLLQEFSAVFSTYDPNALLYKFNHNTLTPEDIQTMTERQLSWTEKLFKLSFVVYNKTNGAFNPGIGPLLTYWGFNGQKEHPANIDSAHVDSLKQYSDFNDIFLQRGFFAKSNPLSTLNFNAIAAGYATDIMADYLQSLGINDYLINITGEVRAKGVNPSGEIWLVEIEKPIDNVGKNPGILDLRLDNKAMATSGNYRNYFLLLGEKYGHTIDPRTGFPAQNSLLSATVISKYGALSDSYATAFLVMGFEEARAMVESDPSVDAVLIFEDKGEMKTWISWEANQ
jgi:FAD:protein FMN transferase